MTLSEEVKWWKYQAECCYFLVDKVKELIPSYTASPEMNLEIAVSIACGWAFDQGMKT